MHSRTRIGVAVVTALVLTGAAFAVDFRADCYQQSNHEIFTSAFQRFVTSKHSGDVRKTTAKPTAGLVGYRYSTPQLSAGIAVSYESGLSKNYLDNGNFRMRDETLGISLFGKYTDVSGWYAQGSLFTGFNNKKVRDGHMGGVPLSYDGKDSSTYFAGALELGKNFEFGAGTRVTPHAGFNYAFAPSSDLRVREGNASRRYDVGRQNFFEIPVGVTFARDFYAADWVLTPAVDLTMISSVGNVKDENYNYRSGFSAYDGSKWLVHGVGSGHWGGRVSAGINAVKSERFDVGVNYTYEGRKKYDDHRITAGVGIKF